MGMISSMEDAVKPIWRSGYALYKRAQASGSCYVADSWERLKLPFVFGSDWLFSKYSEMSGGYFGVIHNVLNTTWRGMWNIFNLFQNILSNFREFLFAFLSDFLRALRNLLIYSFSFCKNLFFIAVDGMSQSFDNSIQFLKYGISALVPYFHLKSEKQKISDEKWFEGIAKKPEAMELKGEDWSIIKKKISDLEFEFEQVKESMKNKNRYYDQKLEDNNMALQKYQAQLNYAVSSPRRPGQMSGSSVQYLLDNHSDALKQWIMQNFLLKTDSVDVDENKLARLIGKYTNQSGEDLLKLQKEFKVFILNHKKELETLKKDFNSLTSQSLGKSDISVAYINKLVGDAIKLYDADKTGKVDYALGTAGGQIQSIRCTETYVASPMSYILMGWTVYTKASSPRDAITPGTAAGQCWAFVGSQGFLVIQLSHTITVTGFTMEHVSKSVVPRNHIESAPKNFSMWGLRSEHDAEPYLFGEYMYADNDETLQYFPVAYPTSEQYNLVELKIISNHGNPNYTCLYRIRVHGNPLSIEE